MRIPLSCDPCRIRKYAPFFRLVNLIDPVSWARKQNKVHGANGQSRLKCNREKPCQNCITRNQREGCHFQGAASHSPPLLAATDAVCMRQRIDRLEALVKRLVADSSPQSSVSSPEIAADRGVGAGKTVMDGNQSVYVGDGDWRVVLEEVPIFFPSLGEDSLLC